MLKPILEEVGVLLLRSLQCLQHYIVSSWTHTQCHDSDLELRLPHSLECIHQMRLISDNRKHFESNLLSCTIMLFERILSSSLHRHWSTSTSPNSGEASSTWAWISLNSETSSVYDRGRSTDLGRLLHRMWTFFFKLDNLATIIRLLPLVGLHGVTHRTIKRASPACLWDLLELNVSTLASN